MFIATLLMDGGIVAYRDVMQKIYLVPHLRDFKSVYINWYLNVSGTRHISNLLYQDMLKYPDSFVMFL